MEPTMHTNPSTTDSGTHQSLRATIALAICGAIGGASILEAITSAWLHPATSAPTAEPIALVGAVIGAVATLVIQRRRAQVRASDLPVAHESLTDDELEAALDLAPLTPMAWQPVPSTPMLERAGDGMDYGMSGMAWAEPTTCQVGPRARLHERPRRHGGQQAIRRAHPPRSVPAQG